jgi:hypothetical protein
MEFEHSEKVRTLQARVKAFMVEHIYPNEEELFAEVNEGDRWQPVPLRGCPRLAWRPGRQRRAGCFDIAPTGGNISAGPDSSTACR